MRTATRSGAATAPTPPRDTITPTPVPHHRNPALAEALFATASGDRLTLVAAPPGAGKTYLISHLAQQLATRMNLRVAVAAQTREQSYDVANRIAALNVPTRHLRGRTDSRPRNLHANVISITAGSSGTVPGGVTVATSARWRTNATSQYRADILLIDEAYQMTYADLIAIGDLAEQIALVGDPGQIAPVVTGETRRWEGNPAGPHQPAPIALAHTHRDTITTIRMNATHRLGPDTAHLIAPLYPTLPFTSRRTPSTITLTTDLPEHELRTVQITGDHSDPALANAAADRARELLTGTLTTPGENRPLHPTDIAVITPHVHQAALVAANLSNLPGILVATANAAQGLERHAVVAIHPLAGYHSTPSFALDLGRLCVTLTRHRSHLSVITDTLTTRILQTARGSAAGATAEAVRLHHDLLTGLGGAT